MDDCTLLSNVKLSTVLSCPPYHVELSTHLFPPKFTVSPEPTVLGPVIILSPGGGGIFLGARGEVSLDFSFNDRGVSLNEAKTEGGGVSI